MKTTITSNLDQLEPLMEKIRGEYHARGAARAANRTRDKVVTQVRRGLTAEYGIPAAAVARKRVFRAASANASSKPRAIFKVGQWVVPVERFGTPRELKRGGVSYKTVGGNQTDPNAFMVDSLGSGVFNRVGPERLPIRKKSADISEPVDQVLSKVVTDANVGKIFSDEYESTMRYRVDQELAKWRKLST